MQHPKYKTIPKERICTECKKPIKGPRYRAGEGFRCVRCYFR